MNDDEDLRRLLEDAVRGVEPRDASAAIRERTRAGSRSARRSWLLGAGAVVVATAATVLAVTVLGDGPSEDPGFAGPTAAVDTSAPAGPSSSDEAGPTPSEAPTPGETAPPPATAPTVTVPAYYLGDTTRGARLFREFHRVPLRDGDPVATAVHEAVASAPDDRDYRTPWPAGTSTAAVKTPPADVITVDLRGPGLRERPDDMTLEDAELAIEQVVYTAQAAHQSRSPVQLLLDGQRTDTLLGVPVSEPLTQGAAEDVLAQVWVIEPAEGAELTSPFQVTGLAAAYEATVVWELRAGDRVVRQGYTTAQACCAMEPYSFEVEAPPGEYTLVVQDTDPSGGEGFGPWQDTKRVIVLP